MNVYMVVLDREKLWISAGVLWQTLSKYRNKNSLLMFNNWTAVAILSYVFYFIWRNE